jgi:mRNA interferase RelE/StbE
MSETPRWEVILTRQAERALRRLPRPLLQRLDHALAALAENPTPPDCKKLVGHPDLYRVRVGDWRIVYTLEAQRLVVLVIRIAPRGEVYRGL